MIVGLCWPTPWPSEALDTVVLAKIAKTRATHLRINLDYRNQRTRDLLAEARSGGFEVLPILDLDYGHPDIPAFRAFCAEIVTTERFPVVEVLNEPLISGHMKSRIYAEIVNAVAPAIREHAPGTRILIAGEFMKPDRKGPKDDSYFDDVRQRVKPSLYDIVAIHPYREPGAPDTTRHGTRRREYQHWLKKAGKPVWVTEIGWKISPPTVTEGVQGDYVMRELQINDALGVEATFIYAYGADPSRDFGVFDLAQEPRPAAYRIAQFQTRSRSTPPTETAGVA